MSTGSLSDAEEMPEMELRGMQLGFPGLPRPKRRPRGHSSKRAKGAGLGGGGGGGKRQLPPLSSRAARMRVLSKAFSRLKTSLPWVPPDTKLSKLDTLRLASSYIAHLRQLLQEDRYDKAGYVHPVSLTWPFMVSGRPESDAKEVSAANRLCGTTA
uniref:Musculin n=1 Tax=Anolis carolinensis TaxID=28377 RepID=A0A803TIC5_ANOCA